MSYSIAMVGACPFPAPQGSQVFLRDTASLLQRRGHDVCLVVYGYGVGEDGCGMPVHRCPATFGSRRTAAGPSFAKPFIDLAMANTVRRVVREHSVDVLHAHNYEGLVVALAAHGKRPVVYHAHNAMADELPYYFRGSRIAQGFGRWLDNTFPKRADHVIVPHDRLAKYLVTCGCDSERISVIPPAADPRDFDRTEIGTEIPPVVYTGNLDRYQNLDLLTRAMDRIQERMGNARLLVATPSEHRLVGAERIYTPDFTALKKVLAQDCVVACPRVSWSGYPIKLLNAMAAGKAVVACRNAAYPLTDWHDGIVIPDNYERAFANALERLLKDHELRATMGQRALETVLANHAPVKIGAQLEAVYERL